MRRVIEDIVAGVILFSLLGVILVWGEILEALVN